jgi:DNA-binding XRE family transcriptional regulator
MEIYNMGRSLTFDYKAHNEKIAKLRGKSWKKALINKKLEKSVHITAIKLNRAKVGLSQQDMLPRIGIKTQTTYGRIERGERLANKQRAEKISKTLNIPINKLFVQIEDNKFLAI